MKKLWKKILTSTLALLFLTNALTPAKADAAVTIAVAAVNPMAVIGCVMVYSGVVIFSLKDAHQSLNDYNNGWVHRFAEKNHALFLIAVSAILLDDSQGQTVTFKELPTELQANAGITDEEARGWHYDIPALNSASQSMIAFAENNPELRSDAAQAKWASLTVNLSPETQSALAKIKAYAQTNPQE